MYRPSWFTLAVMVFAATSTVPPIRSQSWLTAINDAAITLAPVTSSSR